MIDSAVMLSSITRSFPRVHISPNGPEVIDQNSYSSRDCFTCPMASIFSVIPWTAQLTAPARALLQLVQLLLSLLLLAKDSFLDRLRRRTLIVSSFCEAVFISSVGIERSGRDVYSWEKRAVYYAVAIWNYSPSGAIRSSSCETDAIGQLIGLQQAIQYLVTLLLRHCMLVRLLLWSRYHKP